MVVAVRGGQHGTVVLAEGQQGFLQAETFQQGQAEGLAGAFVLPGGVLDVAVAEGALLVVVTPSDEVEGFGKDVLVAVQAGTEVVQVAHSLFALLKAACWLALASFWYLAFQSA
ncbi:hypothetical protein D3C84_1109480 [compost metagenome]